MKDIINTLIKEYLNENAEDTNSRFKVYIDGKVKPEIGEIIEEFVSFCLDELNISGKQVKVVLSDNRDTFTTFAYYNPAKKIAAVYCNERHTLDIFRSLAHELVHYKQDINGELTDKSQITENNDGSPIENEANSVAGVIMRKFGRKHPELYN